MNQHHPPLVNNSLISTDEFGLYIRRRFPIESPEARFIMAAVAEKEWRIERDRICKEAGWGTYDDLLATGPGYISEPQYREAYAVADKAVVQWRAWGDQKS